MPGTIIRTHAITLTVAFAYAVSIWILMDLGFINLHQDVAALVNHAGFQQAEPESSVYFAGMNIPFEQWFYGLPNIIGKIGDVGSYMAMVALGLIVCLVGFLLSTHIAIRMNVHSQSGDTIWWVAALALAMLVIPLAGTNLFAIREHLVLCLCTPYVLLTLARANGFVPSHSLAVCVGVAAAIGGCAKPFYGLMFVCVEFAYLGIMGSLTRVIRTEVCVVACVGVAYLIAWVGPYGAYFDRLDNMLDDVDGFLISWRSTLIVAAVAILPVPLVCYASAAKGNWSRMRSSAVILGAALVGAVLVGVIQQRWYWHHQYPVIGLLLMFLVVCFRYQSRLLSGLLLTLIAQPMIEPLRLGYWLQPYVSGAVRSLSPMLAGHTVAYLSTHPAPYAQTILRAEAQWRFPFRNMAYLTTLYSPYDKPEFVGKVIDTDQWTDAAKYAQNLVNELFIQQPPEYVLVETASLIRTRHLQYDVLEAISADQEFRHIWSSYAELDVPGFESHRIRVFRRLNGVNGESL